MLCLFHSADLDGKCSAAIVKLKFPHCSLYGINYNEEIPWKEIENHSEVVMVDFGFQPFSDMEKIHNMKWDSFVWIDHHKTAIDNYNEYQQEIEGLREIGKAGCELTWEYFYPNRPMPKIVRMLGRYDVWDRKYSEDVDHIQFGMKTTNNGPYSPIWKDLLHDDDKLYNAIRKKGKTIYDYQMKEWERYCLSNSFDIEWEGFKFIAMNILNASSLAFESMYDPNIHDGMMAFGYKNGKFVVSLYGDKKDIDLSVIAVKYGGGGHPGACGMALEKLPFL